MSLKPVYDTSLTSVFGVMPKHCEAYAKETRLNSCVAHNTDQVRQVLSFRNGAEEHFVTRNNDDRVVAIFARNLKTGAAITPAVSGVELPALSGANV